MSNIPHHIQAVLDDLYALDGSLRAHEADLVQIIERVIAARPHAPMDPRFIQELRSKVLAVYGGQHPSLSNPSHSFFSFMKLKYVALPVGLVAVIALAVIMNPTIRQGMSSDIKLPLAMEDGSVTRLANGAFGTLQDTAMNFGRGGDASALSARSSIGAGGGGAGLKVASSEQAVDLIAPYNPINIKYVYKGELPTWEEKMTVYRRLKGSTQNASLVNSLSTATNGLIDLKRMANLELQSFTINQSTKYGYSITVDLNESLVMMNAHYPEWPHPQEECYRREALDMQAKPVSIAPGEPYRISPCEAQFRIKPEEIPADKDAIAIADRFLADHGISKEKYGAPVVNNDWRRGYDLAADKSSYYLPQSVNVIYPVILEGKTVYDEGGYPSGLSVSINIREKKVESVWNLATQNYQSSLYEAETDAKKIQTIYERGGIYGYQDPNAKETKEVELTDAEIILGKVWMPKQDGYGSDELLVPALRFTVKDQPSGTYTPAYITVPLIKEVLQTQGGARIMM
jgi:hypothetical protein